MLFLNRCPGEKIMIGDDITVLVKSVRGGEVRIAIEAPEDCKIYREEIYNRIQEENDAE